MKMAMKDGKIMLIEVDNTQMAIIKSWNSMKYDRRKNMMIGDCSKELLDKLSKIVRLPPAIESYRQRLDETQRAGHALVKRCWYPSVSLTSILIPIVLTLSLCRRRALRV